MRKHAGNDQIMWSFVWLCFSLYFLAMLLFAYIVVVGARFGKYLRCRMRMAFSVCICTYWYDTLTRCLISDCGTATKQINEKIWFLWNTKRLCSLICCIATTINLSFSNVASIKLAFSAFCDFLFISFTKI